MENAARIFISALGRWETMGGKYIHYCIVCGPTILVLFGVIIRTGSSSSTSTSNFSYLEISLSEASKKISLRADERVTVRNLK